MTVEYFLPVPILFILYYKICKTLNTQGKKIFSLNATCAATSEDSNVRQTSLQRIKNYRNMRIFILSASIVVLFTITALPFVCGATVQAEVITWTYIVSLFGVNPYIYGVTDKILRSAHKRNWKKMKRIFISIFQTSVWFSERDVYNISAPPSVT